jgi:hypothetical protein
MSLKRYNFKSSLKKGVMVKLKDSSGIFLPDLVASLPLAAIVFLIMGLALVNFITTYEETKLFTQLQDDLFYAVETIRYGVTKKNVTDGEGIIGVMTAGKISIQNAGKKIKILPVVVSQGLGEESYSANFWLDNNGQLMANGYYGIKSFTDHRVFPSENRKIGNFNMFRITDLRFSPVKGDANDVLLLGLEIEAQVRFRKKLDKQTPEEDVEKNTKTIRYKTSVLVGNAGKL